MMEKAMEKFKSREKELNEQIQEKEARIKELSEK
jgi:prefoldin subunit 5